jgi:WD repeat-containing protein 23
LDLKPGHVRFCAFSIRFSPDSTEILAGASDYCLYLYDLATQKRTLKLPAHDDDVNTVCFADASSHLFYSSGDDGYVKVWDRRCFSTDNRKPVGVLVGHTDGVTFVSSKGDGRYLISNGKDQTMKLWDVRKMKDFGTDLPKMSQSHRNWDYRYQHCPMRRARIVNPQDMSLMTYTGHRVLQTLVRCYFSPTETTGQRYLYTGSADGIVFVYDVLTGKIVQKLIGHSAVIRDVSWHPRLPLLLSSSWDCTVRCYEFYNSVGQGAITQVPKKEEDDDEPEEDFMLESDDEDDEDYRFPESL